MSVTISLPYDVRSNERSITDFHRGVVLFSKNFDSKHEAKQCPRCQRQFICKANRIHRCDCSNICLSFETAEHIRQYYDECLCLVCLKELEAIVTSLK
jgi:hypothetical protein